jgi:hypothetical protein
MAAQRHGTVDVEVVLVVLALPGCAAHASKNSDSRPLRGTAHGRHRKPWGSAPFYVALILDMTGVSIIPTWHATMFVNSGDTWI